MCYCAALHASTVVLNCGNNKHWEQDASDLADPELLQWGFGPSQMLKGLKVLTLKIAIVHAVRRYILS